MLFTAPRHGEHNVQAEPTGEPWRPIHYLGSKLRILGPVTEAVHGAAKGGGLVCDLFAGSGTVSLELAKTRRVAAVDIQEYSRVLTSALLQPGVVDGVSLSAQLSELMETSDREGLGWVGRPLAEYEAACVAEAESGNPEALCELLELGSLLTAKQSGATLGLSSKLSTVYHETLDRLYRADLASAKQSLIFRYFGGLYFSFKQAADLDLLLELASRYQGVSRDLVLAACLSTASELVNTVGKQFAQPIRPRDKQGAPKRGLSALVKRDRKKATFSIFAENLHDFLTRKHGDHGNSAVRSDYAEFLASSTQCFDVIYADPPYTRDHYSRFYHVLETMSLRDNPAVSASNLNGGSNPSRGAYRLDRHQSPFCIRSSAPAAFDRLFALSSSLGAPLVLSYSAYSKEKDAHPRVLSLDDIYKTARAHYRSVEIASPGSMSHSRLNRRDLNKEISREAESLFICKN